MIGTSLGVGLGGSYDESTRTLSVSGDLDDPRAFEALLATYLQSAGTSYVDLSAVTFLPSSAIGVLVATRRSTTRAGGSLGVTCDDGTIAHRVLAVAGFPMTGAVT